MSGSIPASAIVNATPSVVSAGPGATDLSLMLLSNNTSAPTTPTAYSSASAVSTALPGSVEAALAAIYFSGYTIGTTIPGKLWIYQVPTGDTPAQAMASVVATTRDWATLAHAYQETSANMAAYATWVSGQNSRYVYIPSDNDTTAATTSMAATAIGEAIKTNNYAGIAPIYDNTNAAIAAAGFVASIDYTRTNGRATLAFKSVNGITANVTDQTTADNLTTNGYNYYGDFATAKKPWVFFLPGQVSGPFKWLDSYVDQIWLNSYFQNELITLLVSVNAVPYNQVGYTQIEQTLQTPINAALNNGVIRRGVTLDGTQTVEVNTAAGKDIATTISSRGWYLQVLDPGATVRAARGTPVINFWYADGGAVQKISLASIEIQ